MKKNKFWLTIIGVVLVIIMIDKLGLFQYFNQGWDNVNDWIASFGAWSAIAFIIIYIFATIFLIPGSALTLGGGLIFGVVQGSILVSIASVAGATLSFLIGRYLLRTWVEKQIDTQPKFKAIDAAVAQQGWKIVGLTRLSPLFPFIFLNYAFGVTKVSLRDYFFASWIGMLPGTLMYVYIGSIPKTALETTGKDTDILPLILNIIGLIATITVTIYVTKIAQKALDTKVN
ncbi:DedA family protein [Geminocystis sp. NIES-3708]|uniref:TVP38/TMEM64 family protein n=1 Tax=Geminocystis sp. NIES-3708 TaxID=1615909 RepID=UPI0005FCC91A|nr:TVP38/TMEM64 family protein [Geminocystis sp. NIES-3708]BAQ59927.1 DedA family protein [Geminocystis sp. NIES-3708]